MKPLMWFQVIYLDHMGNRRHGDRHRVRRRVPQEISYRAIRRWKPLYIIRIIPKHDNYVIQPPRRLRVEASS